MRPLALTAALPLVLALAACNAEGGSGGAAAGGNATAATAPSTDGKPFTVTPVAQFAEPWAMTFLPDGRMLVTEKAGKLKLVSADGKAAIDVSGVPAVAYAGQGGLGDVVIHPDFAGTGYVYLSYAEKGEGGQGAAVARAKLVEADGGARLDGLQVIWRQEPKVDGDGHYGHRLAFSPDGFLFISSGERQKFTPAQDMDQNLGKIIRLTDTGGIPSENPFYDQGRIKAQIWSYGHRNPLGLAFAADGTLWEHEMGPEGGDEFNRIEKGSNYGYPLVSNGDHYDGKPIPDHDTRPELNAPEVSWTPVISPAGLVIYSGDSFPAWKGSALIGGLSSKALVRVAIDGTTAREAERFDMGERIREVEQGPDGAVWLIEDQDGAGKSGGRLLKLTPAG